MFSFQNIQISPKQLFLIDSFGALVSAFMLGIVLVEFNDWFKMPIRELYILGGLAVVFAVYSFLNYTFFSENWRSFMKIIAIVNLLYCVLTMSLVIYHLETMSILGIIYFILESIIIIILARIELKMTAVK